MAKPSAAMHTPRPSALRSSTSSCSATRSSVGSTSSSTTAAAAARNSAAKVVAKCLVYDDDDHFTLPSAVVAPAPHPNSMKTADGLAAEEDDLAPLLELRDPDAVPADTSVVSADNSASTSFGFSAAADDALTASADSCVTVVGGLVPVARADSATDDTAAALPEEIINVALAELRGAGSISPRSKRLLSALGEAAALELTTNTAVRDARLRRAGFWGKVRVAVVAGTLAADIVLAAYLYARRANERYVHAMPPPT